MSVLLKEIFYRPLDRAIEGVIKADDEAALRTELEEYVLTREIETQLGRFLEAYNDYETANGVWISGFFGSGKSHLLKMLALLLENREVEGTKAFEFFQSKCADNDILKADLKKAVAIPSKSILFNIDQKADVISKTEVDALLSVFQKVFDEMCGYYGKLPHVAQFERELDSRGQYIAFKAAYAQAAGKPWETGREQTLLETVTVAKAYAAATGQSEEEGRGIINRYRQDYRSSIEDFAQRVKDYIASQGPRFRLNFFVDEVGQYIAENVKLMTNLQTIAESLNTKCRGQAWIIVTAQQDMAAVIGDVGQKQENDFSKIQARFANRIPLNSADVAEVIQKRLLTKTEAGILQLEELHHREAGNLKTLFDFTDGSQKLENFRDREHFIKSYPFVPYQYALFQMAIQNLSQHNAFEGKHSSVGERSMLGVFQEVAVRMADMPVGHIATFDQMFEGIRTALKSSVQQSILIAERNLGDDFATRVLKALFLVKYVKGFKSTTRNIAILLQDDFTLDQTQHRRRIEQALAVLEQNTYIQRNGDYFEFLTDEEKDVEEAIKATEVDMAEVAKDLQALIFDHVLKGRKIHHEASGNDFPFTQMLDDKQIGRDYALKINVITPLHEAPGNISAATMRSLSNDEVVIVLRQDSRFVNDLLLYKKTDKYVRQTGRSNAQASVERIISEKGQQNANRHRELITKVSDLLGDATMLVRGAEIEVRSDGPQARVERAFQTLVDKIYTNLPMLRGQQYDQIDIGRFLKQERSTLISTGEAGLSEPEREILNYAQSNVRTGVRTTARGIVNHFEAKPYGWNYHAILALTAMLFGKGKVEAKLDGATVEGVALERALKNDSVLPNLVLDLQIEFTPGEVRTLKSFFVEFFDDQPSSDDAKLLALETERKLADTRTEVAALLGLTAAYPFVEAVRPMAVLLAAVSGKAYAWYLREFGSARDELLNHKDDTLGPIRQFMGGSQKAAYDEASAFLNNQSDNLTYIASDSPQSIREILASPTCYKGGAIQQLKGKLDALRTDIGVVVAQERQIAKDAIQQMQGEMAAQPEWLDVSATLQETIKGEFTTAIRGIESAELIAVVKEGLNRFKSTTYPALLQGLVRAAAPPPPAHLPPPAQTTEASSGGEEAPSRAYTRPPPPPPEPPRVEFVPFGAIEVRFGKTILGSEQDVADYIETLRKALSEAVSKGKRITL